MATLKSEFLSHYQDDPRRAAALAAVRRDPDAQPARRRHRAAVEPAGAASRCCERVAGIDRRRPLPRFARETLIRWDRTRPRPRAARAARSSSSPTRFTTFTEPGVGRAAIELLEAAGYDVRLESGGCCGRASISKGLLDQARGDGRGA